VAQFVVRHIEDEVVDKLKKRAKGHARSMEDEVRHILRNAVQEGPRKTRKLGSRIAQRFQGAGLRSDLPEWRGQVAGAADFDS
jgi:plasmid stability protein